MDDLFKVLLASQNNQSYLQSLQGKALGCQWAIVTESEPELKRVKVRLVGREASTEYNLVVLPCEGLTVPLPTKNQVCLVSPINGDTTEFALMGYPINNQNKPDASIDSFVYKLGASVLRINPLFILIQSGSNGIIVSGEGVKWVKVLPDGSLDSSGNVLSISVDEGAVAVTNCTSFTLNGKEVATIGAKDTDNDTLITRGY